MGGAAQRVRGVFGAALQTSVAAGLSWYVAHDLLGHAQPFFAPIAAAVALSTSHVQRARRSAQMMAGVLLGIGVAELLQPLLGSGALPIGLVVFVTLILAVALGFGFFGEGMMFVNQAAASAILVIAFHRSGTGGERAIDAIVGGAVAFVIGVGLFPADPLKLIWESEYRVLSALQGILSGRPPAARNAGDLPAAQNAGDMDPALSASYLVHRRLTTLTQARDTARVSVRVAPRRMLMRGAVEAEETRVARMYLLASGVLTLMRTMADIGETSGALSDARESEVRDLAGALELLLRAPRPWPELTIAGVTGKMRDLCERPIGGETPAGAIVASAARRVAGDVINLLPEGRVTAR
jgi:uncharacterized membrane protein YgaE (UPF0421/DUF939 family)